MAQELIPYDPLRNLPERKLKKKVAEKVVTSNPFSNIAKTAKSIVKKGVGFGAAGAALTGGAYILGAPSRRYEMAPKVGEDRDLRTSYIWRGDE